MTRRLLPYEHELIRLLQVSESDYLDFLSAQHDYTRSPEEKLQELQGDPVSITIAVIGVLFQVASALLAPKPEIPTQQAGRQRREQVFAPRFGFNSQQELAKYGDPVNLVYCNTSDNATGGVRVATSLIWSAVHSEGSSQFMQMMLAVGASDIGRIDAERIAFGQTPIRQLAAGKTWAYLGANRPLQFSDLIRGSATDPTRVGEASTSVAYRTTLVGDQHADGFSQSFSPSTMNRFGVYAPIPINVNYIDRDQDGKQNAAPLGIEIDGIGAYWPSNVLNKTRPVVPLGQRMTLIFRRIGSTTSDTARAAKELRRTLSSYIDAASTYKLGSAKFRVAAPITNVELEDGAMAVVMECVEPGVMPYEDYGTKDFKNNGKEAQNEIVVLQSEISALDQLITLNEPILKPGFGDAANARLEELRARKQQLADLTDRQWSNDELEIILNGSISVDGPVKTAATAIDDLRDKRRAVQASIDDELEKDSNKRNTENIKKWKLQIVGYNKEIKKAQARLDRRLERYGLADYVYNWNYRGDIRRTAKQERAWIIDSEKAALNDLYKIAADANAVDAAAMATRNAQWAAQKQIKQARIVQLQNYLASPNNWNDFFNTKCLVKLEEAGYETITQCRVVDFALKAKIFKRIQGRASEYGQEKVEKYRDSDNGTKVRAAFFWLRYRRTGQAWSRVPYIFGVRRGADVDNFMSLKFIATDNTGNWQFRFDPIAETAAEMIYGGVADFAYIENSGAVQTISGPAGGQFTFKGTLRTRSGYKPSINVNPYEVDEWGLFSVRSDTQTSFSFEGGPEFTITAVTEQRVESFSTYPNLYSGLTLLGFNAYSGQGIQDLRSVSVFALEGKKLRRLRDDGTYPATPDGSSSYAPDIFLDTILDPLNGIGRFAKVGGIDLQALALAKRFCQRNGLFMDGVIAERGAWRQFWAEVAPYSLLELGRIGGRETLVPAVPCDNAGTITRNVPISALFNAGNILEDSYKEEFLDFGSNVQDLIASIIYRDTEVDGVFPRNRSVEISRSDATELNAVRQTFDLSQFVTNRSQAVLFGKLLCQQRRYVRRAIEFRTFPTDSPLIPGAYIYVAIGENRWDQVTTGVVEAGGVLNTPIGKVVNGSGYTALLYKSGSQVTTATGVSVSNGTAASLASYQGWMFVLGTTITRKRVFRITEVQMDEEGEVSVKALEHPCEESGSNTLSLIANLGDSIFTIR